MSAEYPDNVVYGRRIRATDGVFLESAPVRLASPGFRVQAAAYDGENFLVIGRRGRSSYPTGESPYELVGVRLRGSDGAIADSTPVVLSTLMVESPRLVFDGLNYVLAAAAPDYHAGVTRVRPSDLSVLDPGAAIGSLSIVPKAATIKFAGNALVARGDPARLAARLEAWVGAAIAAGASSSRWDRGVMLDRAERRPTRRGAPVATSLAHAKPSGRSLSEPPSRVTILRESRGARDRHRIWRDAGGLLRRRCTEGPGGRQGHAVRPPLARRQSDPGPTIVRRSCGGGDAHLPGRLVLASRSDRRAPSRSAPLRGCGGSHLHRRSWAPDLR